MVAKKRIPRLDNSEAICYISTAALKEMLSKEILQEGQQPEGRQEQLEPPFSLAELSRLTGMKPADVLYLERYGIVKPAMARKEGTTKEVRQYSEVDLGIVSLVAQWKEEKEEGGEDLSVARAAGRIDVIKEPGKYLPEYDLVGQIVEKIIQEPEFIVEFANRLLGVLEKRQEELMAIREQLMTETKVMEKKLNRIQTAWSFFDQLRREESIESTAETSNKS